MQRPRRARYAEPVQPDAPSDPSPRFVTLPSGRVAYTDEGEGPCLVAIHGLPGSLSDYRWLAPALGPSVRFVRLDMPGCGRSEHRDPPTSWPDIALWTLEALDAIVGGPFYLLGHSMGAPQAALVASAGRELVRGLALAAPVGLRPHRAYRRSPPFPWLDAAVRNRVVRHPALALLRAGFVAFGFPRSLSRRDIQRTVSVIANLSFAEHHRAVRALDVPVLGAYADDDPLVEPAIPRELLAACPPGPRLHFETGGHNIQKTRALELGDALRHFVTARADEADSTPA